MAFKAIAAQTDGDFSLMERTVPPRGRRPLAHRHVNCSEAFWVLDGTITFVFDGVEHRGGRDDFVLVPRGASHTFGNDGEEPARLLVLHAPAMDAYFAELEALVTAYRHPRLRALPDVANAYRCSMPPSAADLARLLPFTDMLHIKDYADAAGRFVAVGEGDIPIAALLAATLPVRETPLALIIETHAGYDPVATTRRSVNGLRRMVDLLPI